MRSSRRPTRYLMHTHGYLQDGPDGKKTHSLLDRCRIDEGSDHSMSNRCRFKRSAKTVNQEGKSLNRVSEALATRCRIDVDSFAGSSGQVISRPQAIIPHSRFCGVWKLGETAMNSKCLLSTVKVGLEKATTRRCKFVDVDFFKDRRRSCRIELAQEFRAVSCSAVQ